MDTVTLDIQPVLQDLRAGLEELYGDRLKDVILYGSYARGEAHEGSDIDIVVVLGEPVIVGREIDDMGYLLAELNLRYGQLVGVIPVSERDYERAKGPFWRNVKREGVAL